MAWKAGGTNMLNGDYPLEAATPCCSNQVLEKQARLGFDAEGGRQLPSPVNSASTWSKLRSHNLLLDIFFRENNDAFIPTFYLELVGTQ
jgi:hypothetical protein